MVRRVEDWLQDDWCWSPNLQFRGESRRYWSNWCDDPHSLEMDGSFSSDISESGLLLPLRSL